MSVGKIEISVKGKWLVVPTISVSGKNLVVHGRRLKMAVVHDEEWLETEVEDPALCVRTLKDASREGFRTDLFTFSQKVPNTKPKYDYPMEWDSVATVGIGTFKEWWASLPQETRKNVRRAEKRGVVLQVRQLDDGLLRDLLVLNNDSPIRQGKVFTHFGKTIEQVRKDQRDFLDRRDYICAYCGGELIGGVKLIYPGDGASILTFLPKASHNDKRPANAMIAKVVEVCEQKGIKFLTYGMFNYGKKKNTPLREFKIRNGFQEMLVPRFFCSTNSVGSHQRQNGIASWPDWSSPSQCYCFAG